VLPICDRLARDYTMTNTQLPQLGLHHLYINIPLWLLNKHACINIFSSPSVYWSTRCCHNGDYL